MESILELDKQWFLWLNSLGSESFDSLWMFITNKRSSIPLYIFLLGYAFLKLGKKRFFAILIIAVLMIAFTDQTTNLLFLTVTPSSAPTNKPNTVPFIGEPSQNIILTNTFFNPTTIEIEMVEHDETTLSYALYGNQSKSVSDGIYTIYNGDNVIYKQFNLFEIKDEFNETLYEVREERDDIDENKNFDDITQV